MHVDLIHQGATTTLQWSVSSDYGYVLIAAVLMALELLLVGFFIAGKQRDEFFNEEWMKTNFGEEHQRATGTQIKKGGYPDMGSGRYSAKLTYEQWYKFNNAQRAHYNFLEWAPSGFVFLFIAGIYFPIPAAVIGLVVIISRLIYSIGYASGGPQGRVIGALINDLAILGLLGLSLASAIMFTMGKEAL